MARTFRFISQDDKILDLLQGDFKHYKILAFHFELLTPAEGHILKQTVDYQTKFENSVPIKVALTGLVLKHSPKWYYKYMDIMPVKVTRLEVSHWN